MPLFHSLDYIELKPISLSVVRHFQQFRDKTIVETGVVCCNTLAPNGASATDYRVCTQNTIRHKCVGVEAGGRAERDKRLGGRVAHRRPLVVVFSFFFFFSLPAAHHLLLMTWRSPVHAAPRPFTLMASIYTRNARLSVMNQIPIFTSFYNKIELVSATVREDDAATGVGMKRQDERERERERVF